MNDIIIHDIETIPSQHNLTPASKERLKRKLDRHMDTRPDDDPSDVEKMLMATSPFTCQVIAVGVKEISRRFPDGEETSIIAPVMKDTMDREIPDEARLLRAWWDYISGFAGTFVGYNSLLFDAYVLKTRSMYHRVPISNKNYINLKMYQSWPHFDLMQHLGNWRFDHKISLEMACEFFSIPSPKDGEVTAKTVLDAYKAGNMKGISKYCMEDVNATYELFKIVKDYVK